LPLVCASLPPPASTICAALTVTSGLCDDIVAKIKEKFDTPEQACKYLGYCGTSCECGVCSEELAGPRGRCLGIPSSCGHQVPKGSRYNLTASLSGASAEDPSNSCISSRCDRPESYGCCLTCFMAGNSISV
jgi:hypothetical protein